MSRIYEAPERFRGTLQSSCGRCRQGAIYLYDGAVLDNIRKLVPSERDKLEITDVKDAYIREGHDDVLVPRRIVDRRGHVRLAARF
jgi:hypothetical protein